MPEEIYAYKKNDPKKQKFRWPKHLVAMNNNLVAAPSQRDKATSAGVVRAQEPEPNTVTNKPSETTSKKQEDTK